jgi:hypothetical protein
LSPLGGGRGRSGRVLGRRVRGKTRIVIQGAAGLWSGSIREKKDPAVSVFGRRTVVLFAGHSIFVSVSIGQKKTWEKI